MEYTEAVCLAAAGKPVFIGVTRYNRYVHFTQEGQRVTVTLFDQPIIRFYPDRTEFDTCNHPSPTTTLAFNTIETSGRFEHDRGTLYYYPFDGTDRQAFVHGRHTIRPISART